MLSLLRFCACACGFEPLHSQFCALSYIFLKLLLLSMFLVFLVLLVLMAFLVCLKLLLLAVLRFCACACRFGASLFSILHVIFICSELLFTLYVSCASCDSCAMAFLACLKLLLLAVLLLEPLASMIRQGGCEALSFFCLLYMIL